MKSLSFLIPAYNDEVTIALQVKDAVRVGKKLHVPFEIIVVDDASADTTPKILSALKKTIKQLHITTHEKNMGYGETIKELYYSAKNEWLFTIPGDYQIEAKEIWKLLPYTKNTDLILGRRLTRRDTRARQRQSRFYNVLISVLFGTNTHDINSVRLMKTNMLRTISLRGNSAFVDAQLVIKAIRAGFSIKEIPVSHELRRKGTGGGGKIKVILPTIWEMVLLFLGLL